jgi:hypothetical protein
MDIRFGSTKLSGRPEPPEGVESPFGILIIITPFFITTSDL